MLNQEKGMRFQPTDQKANAEYNLEDIVLQIVDKIPITDEKHPVRNLIVSDGYKKWLSHPQEKLQSIEAVFQLDQLCSISYLDVGSIWCAIIEIHVGRSDWPAGRQFETLVHNVSLMTPAECSIGKNPNKTQMFSSNLFCPIVAKQQWDRIKLICKQPYKKFVQFGLSFIRVTTADRQKTQDNASVSSTKTASVTSIHKHFFGKKSSAGTPPAKEYLKSKLLKIAGTGENGAEHAGLPGSLSRTAKLVLAASSSNQKAFSPEVKSLGADKLGMFSSHIDQKYGVKFEVEAEEFFSGLKIDESELDKIMIADLRHKFERKKRRKLAKEEKKMFRKLAEEFITKKFGSQEVQDKQPTDAPGSKKASKTKENVVSENSNSIKKVANKNSGIAVKVSGNIDEMKQKLPFNHTKGNKNDTVSTTTEANTFEPLPREIKSPFAERTNPPAKRRKIDMPVSKGSEVTPSKVVFQYKGIRGGEDTELTNSPGNLTVTERGQRNIEGDKDVLTFPSVHVLKYAEKEESCNGADMFYTCESFQTDSSFKTEPVSWDENFTEKIGRGRKRSRGRGSRGKVNTTGVYFYGGAKFSDSQPARVRGRGSRGKVNTTPFDLEGDIISPDTKPTRGRGRGRARGRARGQARNKGNIQSTSTDSQPNDEASDAPPSSPLRAPRGFAKCDGCNDFFGVSLLPAHQERCQSWKTKQKPPVSEKPWLTARPKAQEKLTDMGMSGSKSTNSENTTNVPTPERKADERNSEKVMSPPWLLAAERRLQQQGQTPATRGDQRIEANCNNSRFTSTEMNSMITNGVTGTSGSGAYNTNNKDRPAFLEAQAKQFEKCKSDTNTRCPVTDQNNRNASLDPVTFGSAKSQSECSSFHTRLSSETSFQSSVGSDQNDISDTDLPCFVVSDTDESGDEINNGGPAGPFDHSSIQVECPLCGSYFPEFIIEMHASTCYL